MNTELKPGASKDETKKIIKAGIKELQKYSGDTYNKLVFDYMTERNPQPNIKLAKKWQEKTKKTTQPTMDDIRKAVNDKQLSEEDVVDSYKDDLWWFRAIVPRVEKLKKEDYDKKMKELEGQFSIDQNGNKFYRGDKGKHDYVRYITEDEKDKIPESTPIILPDGTTPGPGPVVTTTVDDKKKKTDGVVPGIKTQKIAYKTVDQRTPWWLQDIIGVAGAAADLARVKRYPPWQATPNVHLPGATFYDPTRELAANAEQANIQTQGAAAFTGPQALSARSAQIQGQALKNAADVMGRYNNLNVGLANELEQNRANILNTASQNQANLDTQLWDKYTIMNQQFDNSKAQARQELRKHYINAITNRAKTQALNTLYPNFQVDPSTGGYVYATDLNYTPTYTGQSDGSVEKQLWKQASEIDPANTLEIWKQLMRSKYKNKSSQYPYQGYDDLQG
jgi:hypothetical protein